MGALLQRLADSLRPRAEANGVTVTIETPAEPCLVDGDSHLLTRAAENLLDNALRYTPGGGSVRVECRNLADRVEFSVSDTGPGIPPHELPNLFAPLYRGETSRSRRTGGVGVGTDHRPAHPAGPRRGPDRRQQRRGRRRVYRPPAQTRGLAGPRPLPARACTSAVARAIIDT